MSINGVNRPIYYLPIVGLKEKVEKAELSDNNDNKQIQIVRLDSIGKSTSSNLPAFDVSL